MLDLVYPAPADCPLCGRIRDPAGGARGPEGGARGPSAVFCADCLQGMTESPVLIESPDAPFERAVAVGSYEGALRTAILKLKYNRQTWLAQPLGDLLAEAARQHLDIPDIIVPVPLYPLRSRERGFNQAELLARVVGRTLHRPVISGNLQRTRPTVAQSALGRSERADNVAGAFRLARPGELTGARILLVDDVHTTGVTVTECANVLLESGAVRTQVCVLASGK